MPTKPKIDRKRLKELYLAGYSVSEIVSEMGVGTIPYVQEILREMGYTVKRKDLIDVPKVKALMQAGWSMRKIVDEFSGEFTEKEIIDAINGKRKRRDE